MSWKWKTIIEPFRAKCVEPLGFTTEEERKEILEKAKFNVFNIASDKILIDLLTDSGTSAMSSEQWAGMMRGDESYAGAKSFYRFEEVVRCITGFKYIIPVHQGRAAERILFPIIAKKGDTIVANSHFDTTRANVEHTGAEALDLPIAESFESELSHPFKGNIDTEKLEAVIRERGRDKIPLVLLTVTNNSIGGQPVSMKNIRETHRICKKYKIPLFLDCARFAENAYFIKLREEGFQHRSPLQIAKEMFSYSDGCMMSAKKDALVNIGGFLAMNDSQWMQSARESLIIGEGFVTYGGLAGRDLEAMVIGLQEVLQEEYLQYRIRSTEYLGRGLKEAGLPIVEPPGGHGIYINAKAFLPHIPPECYPGQALVCELYRLGGIRAVEIGSLMFGRREGEQFIPAKMELVRLAIPRRVYTQSHIDFVIEVCAEIAKNKSALKGLRLLSESTSALSHFTAQLDYC